MSPHKLICVPEYGYLVSEEHVTSETRRVVPVPKSCFEQLLNFVQDKEHEHSDTFLKPALFNKKPALQVKNYVGLIQTACGTQIEILPKLTDKQSHEKGRALLLKMLRTLQSDKFKDAGDADVQDKTMPLLEVYIQQFLMLVQGLVKRGIRSDYIQVQKNSAYLKGRLLVGQQLKKNIVHPERFFIRYQEYQVDRPANRLIKTTLLKVIKLTRRADNQRLARELGFVFQEVPKSHNISLDFKQVKTDRSMGHYNDVLAWCQLLLNGSGPTAYAGSFNTLSLLYPMERLFEDYVAHHLKRDCKALFGENTQLSTQVSKASLVKEHAGKPMFRLKPDLLIKEGGGYLCNGCQVEISGVA